MAATVVAAGEAAVAAPGAGAAPPRPNIVVIYTDDQRVDDMIAMPQTMALMAAQGTTFAHGYSPFPLCCPARSSMLTGQYAHNHGVLGNASEEFPLGGWADFDDTSTVATWLSAAGYQTAYVGKYLNHYGEVRPALVPPGWDEWHASVAGGNYFTTRLIENGVEKIYNGPYQTDLYTDIAVDMIEQDAPSPDPFFLVTGYYAPHSGSPEEPDDPTVALGVNMATPAVDPKYRDAFAGTPLPKDPSYNEADVSDKPVEFAIRKPITSKLELAMTENYQQRLEALLSVDDGVARIFAALQASGELANTVVVFTSDNGWMQGEHRLPTGKAVGYEPSVSVPFFIRGPGFPAGATRQPPATLVDLAPTIADLARATPTLVVDGASLVPLARSPQTWPARPVVVMAGPRSLTGPNYYMGIHTGKWVYLEYGETGEVEFYDMFADPYQLQNLAGDPLYDRVQASLAAQLARLRTCAGPSCR